MIVQFLEIVRGTSVFCSSINACLGRNFRTVAVEEMDQVFLLAYLCISFA